MENILQHNNYSAEIKFSNEDNLFYGKILNIGDLVLFDGRSVIELKKNFSLAIKDYESAKELLAESSQIRKLPEPPMLEFYKIANKSENPKHFFVTANTTFKEGDFVSGSWVNCDGRTYHQVGKIIRHPKTGLWVQSPNDGGITEIKYFFTMYLNSNEPGAVSSHEAEKEVCEQGFHKWEFHSWGKQCTICGKHIHI